MRQRKYRSDFCQLEIYRDSLSAETTKKTEAPCRSRWHDKKSQMLKSRGAQQITIISRLSLSLSMVFFLMSGIFSNKTFNNSEINNTFHSTSYDIYHSEIYTLRIIKFFSPKIKINSQADSSKIVFIYLQHLP